MTESGFETRCIMSQICAHVLTSRGGWLGEGLMRGLYFDRFISAQEIYYSSTGENKKKIPMPLGKDLSLGRGDGFLPYSNCFMTASHLHKSFRGPANQPPPHSSPVCQSTRASPQDFRGRRSQQPSHPNKVHHQQSSHSRACECQPINSSPIRVTTHPQLKVNQFLNTSASETQLLPDPTFPPNLHRPFVQEAALAAPSTPSACFRSRAVAMDSCPHGFCYKTPGPRLSGTSRWAGRVFTQKGSKPRSDGRR